MTEKKRYTIGDYTNCRYNICEILRDGEVYCIVGYDDAEKIINILEENEQLKKAEILANYRGEMIGFATALIDDLGGETMREMWDKFREEKYEDWRKLE